MKNKKINKTITLLLFSVLILPLILGNNNATAATLTPGGRLITDMSVVIKGYDGVDQSSVSSTSFSDTVYNHTIPVVNLQADSFAATDISPTDFKTDGITRTYSDSIYQSLSTSSLSTARGMFSVLQYIKENEFAHFTIEQDITAYTYTPVDSFYTTVNTSMYNENALWTAENFTVSEMYALVTFNREYVDLFFTDVIASDGYQTLIDTQSTNQELIVSVLGSAFAKHCYDIIYSPVNVSTYYDATWTIAEEVQAVLGGNATDTSVNGTLKNTSVRDAFFGFLGQKVVPDATIGAALSAYVPDGVFSAFKATPTTYSFQWNVRADYTGSALHEDLKFLLTILTEAEYEAVVQTLKANLLEAILIAAGVGAGLAIVVFLIRRKKPDKVLATVVGFTTGFLVTLVIYLVVTITVL